MPDPIAFTVSASLPAKAVLKDIHTRLDAIDVIVVDEVVGRPGEDGRVSLELAVQTDGEAQDAQDVLLEHDDAATIGTVRRADDLPTERHARRERERRPAAKKRRTRGDTPWSDNEDLFA